LATGRQFAVLSGRLGPVEEFVLVCFIEGRDGLME
jgi:hypothetical protein